MNKLEPIDILLVTFNRLNFLKKTVKEIYHRTKYPYRLWVANNDKDDTETINYLKKAKGWGYIQDFITLDENLGQASGYKESYKYAECRLKGNVSQYIVQTQDDLIPPDLSPCWLSRMVELIKKNSDHGAIAMRIERTRRRDIDEFCDLIPSSTACPAVFRITSKEMLEKVGFSTRPHWESHAFSNMVKKTGKKLAMATNVYASHIGFVENKGFKGGFTNYHTYSKERVNQDTLQPYPDIESKSNIPIKINTKRDLSEQNKRERLWSYCGVDKRRLKVLIPEQKILAKYAKEGKGVEIGCGRIKSHPNAIGVDVFPFKSVDVVADATDLWMFKDNELDFVIGSHTLEHFPDTKAVLTEWKRIIKPGGIIAMAVPNGELRPRSILGSHKVVLTKEILRIIFKFHLGMRVTKLIDVPDKNKGKESILIVGQKR